MLATTKQNGNNKLNKKLIWENNEKKKLENSHQETQQNSKKNKILIF